MRKFSGETIRCMSVCVCLFELKRNEFIGLLNFRSLDQLLLSRSFLLFPSLLLLLLLLIDIESR